MDKYFEIPACAEASASRRNPKSENVMKEILTPRETAEYLNIHVRTIYRLAKNGDIPCRKVGGSWRFKKEALDQWLSGGEKPS
jgi:excisionase family DNA binding protein